MTRRPANTSGIFIDELTGALKLDTVHSNANVSLRTVGGSIVDGRSGGTDAGAANVLGRAIDLDANGASSGIGGGGNALKIDSSRGSAAVNLDQGQPGFPGRVFEGEDRLPISLVDGSPGRREG